MTPDPSLSDAANAKWALLDALTVERFALYRPRPPASAQQSCPQCRATRETKARRARSRAGSA